MESSGQALFDFDSPRGTRGYAVWQEQRRQAMRELSRKMGLPLGRKVEVWLRNEIRLQGTLRLKEEQLFVPEDRSAQMELVVDNVPFLPAEMTSCVLLDEGTATGGG